MVTTIELSILVDGSLTRQLQNVVVNRVHSLLAARQHVAHRVCAVHAVLLVASRGGKHAHGSVRRHELVDVRG